MGPSDVHVQAAGAWKEGWMARDPGARCVGYRRAASNGADREAGLKAPTLPAQTPPRSGLPRAGGNKLARLPKIAATRVPKSNALGAGNRPVIVAE